ncbi:MAG: SpoIIE family protein phosphatase [Thermoleophilaceae bacterium]
MDARSALSFLAEASAVLAGSLEYERTLAEVASLAVPDFADWCSVDVVQPDGSLRGITSRHPDAVKEEFLMELRRRYREQKGASEGVAHAIATGESELVSVVPPDADAGLLKGPDEEPLYRELAASSYMIVPMSARGRTIGALTFLSLSPGRQYTEADLDFAEHLARRFALAVDNSRLYDEAEGARAQLDTIFASIPVGLALYDLDLRCLRVNQALAEMNGMPPEDHVGKTVEELLGPEIGPEVAEQYRRVIASGEPLLDVEHMGETRARPGEVRTWLTSYMPVRGFDGEVIGITVVVTDVTERRRLLDAERAARRRAAFLAQAGEILDSSLDYEETLTNVTRIAVPAIADWCAIQLVDERGMIRQVAVAHSDPERERFAWELNERFPPDPDARTGAPNVIRTGETEWVPEIPDELLEEVIPDPELLRIIRDLGLTSAITAPLQARGRTLGVISFVTAESARVFGQDDVRLAEDVARRAGVAVENARLYTERSRIAHTLQARLLPGRLPDIPVGELAVRYRAAGELQEVGGDFYDVFERNGGWEFVIGDVVGKGPEAAAATAFARYTLRASAMRPGPPSDSLHALNSAMQAEASDLCTVCVANVTCASDRCGIVIALGGHPPGLLLRVDGTVEPVGEFGTIVGAAENARYTDVRGEMLPGDTLVLYTDGVIETGPLEDQLGEQGLIDVLAGLRGRSPEEIVTEVERTAVEAAGGRTRDDIALIAFRFQPARVAAGSGSADSAPAGA